jgi:hypothetical protein
MTTTESSASSNAEAELGGHGSAHNPKGLGTRLLQLVALGVVFARDKATRTSAPSPRSGSCCSPERCSANCSSH